MVDSSVCFLYWNTMQFCVSVNGIYFTPKLLHGPMLCSVIGMSSQIFNFSICECTINDGMDFLLLKFVCGDVLMI